MKSVAELKEMGFTEVMKIDFKQNKKSGKLEPAVSPKDRQKIMQQLDLHSKEVEDPEKFYQDYLPDPLDEEFEDQSELKARLKEQKRIDQ